jgi:biofilm PGA synthesis N-glycosyltransferase PgaC
MQLPTLGCSIGVMAYNEEGNIGQLLSSLVSQQTRRVKLTEIVVVASGCTDQTQAIVVPWTRSDSRIKLLVQTKREGKASAINHFLTYAQEGIVVLCSADLIPDKDAIEQLVGPFVDEELGISCSRPIPVNDPTTFMGFAAHMLWNLHHQINLVSFKAGEMIAFRKIFRRIPYDSVVDEASIEPVIRGQGYGACYVPTAIVYNKGPDTIRDFLTQRRRIYAGHLAVRHALGYTVSTMSSWTALRFVLRNMDWKPKLFFWTWTVAGLEAYGRILGRRDYKKQRNHRVWEIATTTKVVKLKQSA